MIFEAAQQKVKVFYKNVRSQAIKSTAQSRLLPVSVDTVRDCERVLYILKLYSSPKINVPELERKRANKRWEYINWLLKKQQETIAATAAVIDRLQFNKAESQTLTLYEREIIAVETPGILNPNEAPTLAEVFALLDGQWICDRVIDCYLDLVCHHANGHSFVCRGLERRPERPSFLVDIDP